MTWPMGLARRPARTRSRYSASVLDDAAAGPAQGERRADDGRQADLGEGQVGGRRRAPRGEAPSTIADGAYGWPIRSSRSRNRSRSSAISIASSGVPRSRMRMALEHPGPGQRDRQVERGLAAQPGEQAVRVAPGR